MEVMPREGKTCLHKHFGGAKALVSYINLQVTDSVGGAKQCKIFHLGGNAPVPPAGTCLRQTTPESQKELRLITMMVTAEF